MGGGDLIAGHEKVTIPGCKEELKHISSLHIPNLPAKFVSFRVGQEDLIGGDEELTTQEIEEELAPITVQLAYAQQV